MRAASKRAGLLEINIQQFRKSIPQGAERRWTEIQRLGGKSVKGEAMRRCATYVRLTSRWDEISGQGLCGENGGVALEKTGRRGKGTGEIMEFRFLTRLIINSVRPVSFTWRSKPRRTQSDIPATPRRVGIPGYTAHVSRSVTRALSSIRTVQAGDYRCDRAGTNLHITDGRTIRPVDDWEPCWN